MVIAVIGILIGAFITIVNVMQARKPTALPEMLRTWNDGIPPETIKDSMRLSLDVPTFYVVPKERFNLKFGTNTCEAEFPAYFAFFIKGTSVTLICGPDAAATISKVVDEVLEAIQRRKVADVWEVFGRTLVSRI